MRALRPLLVTLLLAGCAGAIAGRTEPPGTYLLAAVDGAPLPHPSPSEPGVVLEAGTLELARGGAYTLDLVGRVGDGTPDARRVFGAYRLRRRSLVLTPAEPLAPAVRYAVRRAPGVLHLRDAGGAEYTFVRR